MGAHCISPQSMMKRTQLRGEMQIKKCSEEKGKMSEGCFESPNASNSFVNAEFQKFLMAACSL